MDHSNKEKTDVISVILDDRDLLNTFADTLTKENEKHEDFSLMHMREESAGRLQKIRWYLLSSIKDLLHQIAQKTQVLATLAEYHAKKEFQKVRKHL